MISVRDADDIEFPKKFQLGDAFDESALKDYDPNAAPELYKGVSIVVPPQESGQQELGLFTSVAIKEGNYIGTYTGRVVQFGPSLEDFKRYGFWDIILDRVPELNPDVKYVLWGGKQNNRRVGIDGKNLLRFSNHQQVSSANMRLEGFNFYATRYINAKEELTWPYD